MKIETKDYTFETFETDDYLSIPYELRDIQNNKEIEILDIQFVNTPRTKSYQVKYVRNYKKAYEVLFERYSYYTNLTYAYLRARNLGDDWDKFKIENEKNNKSNRQGQDHG